MKRPIVLSYGAGVDSLGMLLRALELGQRPDVVGFVDVADPDHEDPGEWPATYQHIEEHLRPLLAREGIRFEVIDSKRYPVRDARSLFAWMAKRGQIPVAGPNRICTAIAKVERFERWAADTFPGQEIEVWIGFEAGEESRAAKDPNAGKDTRVEWKPELGGWCRQRLDVKTRAKWWERWFRRENRFPMIGWGLCRCRAEKLIAAHGLPIPPKSACMFCPYATRADFQRLAREQPATFAKVVKLEADKPLTKNGAKLSIKNFSTKTLDDGTKIYRPTMLPELVAGTYRAPKPKACEVCGETKAVKTTCAYQAAA